MATETEGKIRCHGTYVVDKAPWTLPKIVRTSGLVAAVIGGAFFLASLAAVVAGMSGAVEDTATLSTVVLACGISAFLGILGVATWLSIVDKPERPTRDPEEGDGNAATES